MNKDSRIQIGIIGCGSITQWRHLPVLVGEMQKVMEISYDNFVSPILSDNPARVIAICDLDAIRLAQAKERYNIPFIYTDYEELLRNHQIDAVIIAIPNEQKREVVRASLEAKKHIFLEKPMAVSFAEAQKMAELIKQSKVKFQIGFNKRYYYGYRIVKQQIDDGEIGDVQGLNARLWVPEPDIVTFSKEVGIHIYDLVYYFVGPVSAVYANSVIANDRFTLGVNLRFMNCAIGLLFFSSNNEFWYPNERIEIIGDRGSGLLVDNGQRVYKTSERGPSSYWEPSLSVHWQTGNEIAGYTRELKHFLNCIISNQDPDAGIESGLHSLQLHEAILESMKSNETITLKNIAEY